LIDFAVFNAYVLFKIRNFLNPSFSDFKLQLIKSIIEKHDSKHKFIIDRPRLSNLLVITRHFPFYIKKNKNHPTEQKRMYCLYYKSKKIANKKIYIWM